jgi:hypothetical protein
MVELWDKRDRMSPDRMLGHTSLNLQRCLQHPNKVFRKTLALRPTDDVTAEKDDRCSPGEVRAKVLGRVCDVCVLPTVGQEGGREEKNSTRGPSCPHLRASPSELLASPI